MKNALSIDLEDWYHPEYVRNHIDEEKPSQIYESTLNILKLFSKFNVKATFFILGEIAIKNPNLIKKIYKEGHEIASHGYSHLPLWELNLEKFDKEVNLMNKIMKNILGNNFHIKGFRAPSFSLNNNTSFALKVLSEHNYVYDSSIFPVRTPLYGVSNAPHTIYYPDLENPMKVSNHLEIIEFPLSVFKLGKIVIPVCGGFYFRLIPYFIFKFLLKKLNQNNQPFVIYFHPWEIFSKTPKIKQLGFFKKFVTYYGIKNNMKKIEKLLNDFEFEPMINIIKKKFRN